MVNVYVNLIINNLIILVLNVRLLDVFNVIKYKNVQNVIKIKDFLMIIIILVYVRMGL